jgi:group I intron endonuclease
MSTKNKKSGIYKIENILNKECCIGQSVNLRNRKVLHFCDLRKNRHKNRHLQNAFNKYGEESFIFEVILYCEPEELTYYEQKLVDIRNPEYNINKRCVNSSLGTKRTDETRKKQSDVWIGRFISEETKRNISSSRIGLTNRRGIKQLNRKTSSKYVGVYWHKRNKRWESAIKFQGKKIYLGGFIVEEDAATAYNNAALKYFGENAKLNIINNK